MDASGQCCYGLADIFLTSASCGGTMIVVCKEPFVFYPKLGSEKSGLFFVDAKMEK